MTGRFLRLPDLVRVVTDGPPLTAARSGENWSADAVEVRTIVSEWRVSVTVAVAKANLRWLQLRWFDGFSPEARYLGDAWERSYGELEWRGCVPDRVMPWYFVVHEAGHTSGLGVRVQPGTMCSWQVDYRGVSLWLDCRCGGEPADLLGRELLAAEIVSVDGCSGETPFQVARALCSLMCGRPRMPAHPVFGGNNWYHAFGNSTRDAILAETARIAQWSAGAASRPFMVIDSGWGRAEFPGHLGGPWDAGNARFADMPGLVAAIRQHEVKPGIWFRPLQTSAACPASWILAAPRRHGWVERGVCLDPTVGAVQELITADTRRFSAEWGCELIKHDFSTYDLLGFWGSGLGGRYIDDGWTFSDRTRTTAEIVTGFYRLLRDAAGDVLLLGCNTVGHLSAGLFDVHRAGDDSSARSWDRTRRMNVNALAFRLPQHGAFFAVDADCVPVVPDVPWEFTREWLTLLARSGTPLFVSADPAALTPERERSIAEAFAEAARASKSIEPLDWLDCTTPEFWRIGGERQRFNWTGEAGAPAPCSWPYSDLPPPKDALVRAP